jgi:hypothetical protein
LAPPAHAPGAPEELLASVCGRKVMLWRLALADVAHADAPGGATAVAAAPPFEHPADVCSADWNMLATTLATAALDGRVRLWNVGLLGDWSVAAP